MNFRTPSNLLISGPINVILTFIIKQLGGINEITGLKFLKHNATVHGVKLR